MEQHIALSTNDEDEAVARGIRDVTEDEVAHFRKNGWVKLTKLFPPEIIAGLLERAVARMGHDPLTVSRGDPDSRIPNEYGWYARWDGCSHNDLWMRSVSHSRTMARIAARLLGGAARFYFDHIFVKRPELSGGTETPWHQDLAHHPLDRHGPLTVWAPLTDCPSRKGTMRFLNGSHRAGLFGRYLNRRDGICLVDEHPWVLERYSLSEPIDLQAGDVTVHDFAIVHYAQANETTEPRWVYVTQWLPPSVRYTGAPHHRTDGLDLLVDQPLDHPRFPIIVP